MGANWREKLSKIGGFGVFFLSLGGEDKGHLRAKKNRGKRFPERDSMQVNLH